MIYDSNHTSVRLIGYSEKSGDISLMTTRNAHNKKLAILTLFQALSVNIIPNRSSNPMPAISRS